MPIIVRAHAKDSTLDLIKRFKKAAGNTDIVQQAKDRKYHRSASSLRVAKRIEMSRLRRRARSLKRMKNVPVTVLARLNDRLGRKQGS